MELVAKVQAGDLGSVVAERQAEDSGPFLGEEAHMTQVVTFEFNLTVSYFFYRTENEIILL
jgi:hypothetical protein